MINFLLEHRFGFADVTLIGATAMGLGSGYIVSSLVLFILGSLAINFATDRWLRS